MEGFFSRSALKQLKKPLGLFPDCDKCRLYLTCKSPKMPVDGQGQRKILVVGEAPGSDEDDQNRPFVGVSGDMLLQTLRRLGAELRRDCWIANSVVCRPIDNKLPPKAIDYCRPNVINTIQQLKPQTIILLGKSPVESVIGHLWKEDVGDLKRWVGWRIPCRKWNAWVCPTYHPAHLLRQRNPVLEMMFSKHLQAALELENRPWETIPDYASNTKLVRKPEQAACYIREITKMGKPTAFDYETNMLRPYADSARIVACSLCNGQLALAFPWEGEAVTAMKEFLRSDVPKIGASLKMEESWSNAEFGFGVTNWIHDVVLCAHVLDNRKHIAGVKFQSFVQLGQEDYDSHIRQYLKADGSNQENRIREIPLTDLLLYCALDSILEWRLWRIQTRRLT